MLCAQRRLRNGLRVRSSIGRPFDLARRRASGNQPVVACSKRVAGELNFDAAFEADPASLCLQTIGNVFARLIPTPQLESGLCLETSVERIQLYLALGRVNAFDVGQRVRRIFQFSFVVNNLGPPSGDETQELIFAYV